MGERDEVDVKERKVREIRASIKSCNLKNGPVLVSGLLRIPHQGSPRVRQYAGDDDVTKRHHRPDLMSSEARVSSSSGTLLFNRTTCCGVKGIKHALGGAGIGALVYFLSLSPHSAVSFLQRSSM